MSLSLMSSTANKEVASELLPLVRVYKDGSVDRLSGSPLVLPPSPDAETVVTAKDITISQNPLISARVYLPKLTEPSQKLPVLVYFHGGGFCFESAFSLTETKLMTGLVSEAKIVAVSVEYRLAPENSIPMVYDDCWTGLQWAASHSGNDAVNEEPWLTNYGDFDRVFIGGDSAGGNIAHNILLRAGAESLKNGVKISAAFLTHPYFWGSKPVGAEPVDDAKREELLPSQVWKYLYPSAPGGLDNPMINFSVPGAPSPAGLGCSRLLVTVAELDVMRDRGVMYYEAVKDSGWKGEVELIDVDGEDHAFHILNYESENAKNFIKRLALFLLK